MSFLADYDSSLELKEGESGGMYLIKMIIQ